MTILRLLENIRTPFGEQFFQLLTYFGEELLVIVVICSLYWCFNKKAAYRIGLIYFTAGLTVQVLKITFRIPRPWVLDSDFKAVESAIPAATGYSFPSGHTQSGTCLYAPLAAQAKKIFTPQRTYWFPWGSPCFSPGSSFILRNSSWVILPMQDELQLHLLFFPALSVHTPSFSGREM